MIPPISLVYALALVTGRRTRYSARLCVVLWCSPAEDECVHRLLCDGCAVASLVRTFTPLRHRMWWTLSFPLVKHSCGPASASRLPSGLRTRLHFLFCIDFSPFSLVFLVRAFLGYGRPMVLGEGEAVLAHFIFFLSFFLVLTPSPALLLCSVRLRTPRFWCTQSLVSRWVPRSNGSRAGRLPTALLGAYDMLFTMTSSSPTSCIICIPSFVSNSLR